MTDLLRALYTIRTDAAVAAETAAAETVAARALGIALEQSVELPAAAIPPEIVEAGIPGDVESLTQTGDGLWQAWIRYRVENTGFEVAQLLNVLFGNTSLQPAVALIDAELPPSLLAAFAGPRYGMVGLRRLLGAPSRPLTCTALKPMGLPPQALAAQAERFARAGIDVIKEDHGIATQSYAPFAERVRLCCEAIERAAQTTGRRVLYAPNLSGSPAQLREQIDVAQEAGVTMVMAAPMLIGLPVFHELVAQAGFALLGHPALSGALRISPALLLGKLYRLIGADAVIFVNHGGRFGAPPEEVRRLAANLRGEMGALRPAFPVPAGGMTPERVAEMVRFYGPETMLLVSGALYPDDGGLEGRARAFVAATHAAKMAHAAEEEAGA